jgi:hypothetical protein
VLEAGHIRKEKEGQGIGSRRLSLLDCGMHLDGVVTDLFFMRAFGTVADKWKTNYSKCYGGSSFPLSTLSRLCLNRVNFLIRLVKNLID